MNIQTELTRITNAKAAIKTAIEGKGVTVPDGTLLDGMAALVESIEAGGGGGIVKGTFTLAAKQTGYAFAEIEDKLNPPDVILVYKTDYIEDDMSWLIAVSIKIADKFYQAALRNNSTLNVIKSSTSDLFSSSCIRLQELVPQTKGNLICYMTSYSMQPGTYEYIYYWF